MIDEKNPPPSYVPCVPFTHPGRAGRLLLLPNNGWAAIWISLPEDTAQALFRGNALTQLLPGF